MWLKIFIHTSDATIIMASPARVIISDDPIVLLRLRRRALNIVAVTSITSANGVYGGKTESFIFVGDFPVAQYAAEGGAFIFRGAGRERDCERA
jgi:hypothetical protein